MGQVNSHQQCPYHHSHSRVNPSQEGYCALCDERFSNFMGANAVDDDGDIPMKGKGKGKCKESESDKIETNSRSYISHNPIYRCNHCTRFFYSEEELLKHASNVQGGVSTKSSRPTKADHAYILCGICKRSYTCGILDHLNSALVHIQRPEISRKDIETERMRDCCVRCGIYFASKEMKRKHFRDVEHHILHVQAELDNEADPKNEYCDLEDVEDQMTNLFPILPPTKLPLPFKPAQSVISLSSSYAPELRVAPSAGRFGYLQASSSMEVGPSSGMQIVTIEEQFECPLCLENEMDIASLPCGHVYGVECIRKTIASDPRCPLCRRAAEMRHIRRVSPETKPGIV